MYLQNGKVSAGKIVNSGIYYWIFLPKSAHALYITFQL